MQMLIIEYKYIFTGYKCELLNTSIFLLNTKLMWITEYKYIFTEYKYELLNVKWCYWILQQFGNHSQNLFPSPDTVYERRNGLR